MPNYEGNESSLVKYQPKWRSGKTKTIRVPIAIADLTLEAAVEIDKNGNQSLLQVIQALKSHSEAYSTDTSDLKFDRDRVKDIFESMLAAPSNKGGQIKELAAELGNLLGFEIKKEGRKWTITDTSD